MSFISRNHPQQVGARGALGFVDDRETDPGVFGPLHERHRFTVDAAASDHNAKLPHYWTIEHDGLEQDWRPERVWCNPPYSNIRPWVQKAWASIQGGCELAVLLVPANRTEQKWWQEEVEPFRDCGRGLEVNFLPGRMRFIAAGDTSIKPNARPPFGCCLLIFAPPVAPEGEK